MGANYYYLGDALVVIEAGDLAKGSALRRLFEDDEKAAAKWRAFIPLFHKG